MKKLNSLQTRVSDASLDSELKALHDTTDQTQGGKDFLIPGELIDKERFPLISGFGEIEFSVWVAPGEFHNDDTTKDDDPDGSKLRAVIAHLDMPELNRIAEFVHEDQMTGEADYLGHHKREETTNVAEILDKAYTVGVALHVDNHQRIESGLWGQSSLIFEIPANHKPEAEDIHIYPEVYAAYVDGDLQQHIDDKSIPADSEEHLLSRILGEASPDDVVRGATKILAEEDMLKEAAAQVDDLEAELRGLRDSILLPRATDQSDADYLQANLERLLDLAAKYQDGTLTPEDIFA